MEMFEILTDSSANLSEEVIERYHLHILPLSYYVDGIEYKGFEMGQEFRFREFYTMMRNRKEITTSEVSAQDAFDMCKNLLDEEKDILYIGFSSALSDTFQMVQSALSRLQRDYPKRQIYAVDSLGAALGEGLFVYYTAQERQKGKSIDEVYRWAMDNRLYICHEFTVDDLFFLRRGGRISAATAILGTTLGIKPVMHMDSRGRLVEIGKTRGRKKSLDALVNHMQEYALEPEQQMVYISHGDCEEDARYVADQVRKRVGVKDIKIRILDPVIGAHSGPGTVALFYYGEHRRKRIHDEALTHVFIVNPVAGMENFAGELREKLQKIEGLNYFVFSTRYAGYEKAIIKQVQELFLGERVRFYCCGGSGTLRNMLNGFENPEEAEIALYPCGLSNDILKVFGARAQDFRNVEELVHGEVVEVDYIRTNRGICLNSFSLGMDSDMLNAMNKYRGIMHLGHQLPYTLSIIDVLFANKARNVTVYIDGQKTDCRAKELVFGNGCTIGGNLNFADGANLRDGKGEYMVAPSGNPLSLLCTLNQLRKKKFEKASEKVVFGSWRQARIVSQDGEPLMGNQDGELVASEMEWMLEIVPKGLHLVIPKGVSV